MSMSLRKFLGLSIISLIVGIGLGILIVDNKTTFQPIENKNTILDLIDDCRNMDIFKTTECMNKAINEKFNYKQINDIQSVSVEQVLKNGGDCHDWALIYRKMAQELDFNVENVIIRTHENLGHEFIVIADQEGYCVLDMTDYFCRRFE